MDCPVELNGKNRTTKTRVLINIRLINLNFSILHMISDFCLIFILLITVFELIYLASKKGKLVPFC